MNTEIREYVNMWMLKYVQDGQEYDGHNFNRGFPDEGIPSDLSIAIGNAVRLVQEAYKEHYSDLGKNRIEFILSGNKPWSSRGGITRGTLWNLHLLLKVADTYKTEKE